MTRAQGPDSEIDYGSAGSPGASRTVVVLRTGALATIDPAPHETDAFDVRLVLVHLDGPELDDPSAYGGETPAGSTSAALADLVRREGTERPFGLVAERSTSAIALSFAAALGAIVDTIAIVAAPLPESALDRQVALPVLAKVSADVLLLTAASDPPSQSGAQWYGEALPSARFVEVPAEEIDSPDGRLGIADAWPYVLTHVAGEKR